jgi:hypothetical protein
MKHIMVDLETLATTADAVILSLGAVRFDLEKGKLDDQGFYASISIESNIQVGRRVDESTLIWWMKQTAAAQHVFHEAKQPLHSVLNEFGDWLQTDDNFMWSNGADFDIPMLAHAFTQHHCEVPWRHWNIRCFRTYKNLPGAAMVPKPTQGIAHNALVDAVNQAHHAIGIYKALFRNSMVKA